MKHAVLIANRFLSVPAAGVATASSPVSDHLATVLANMAYYGFAPSTKALMVLRALDTSSLTAFWQDVEPAFRTVTGDDRNMAEFVVYKNFPSEVLAKTEAQYWCAQIWMYLGAPAGWFAEEPVERPALNEKLMLKVLELADDTTLAQLYSGLVRSTSRWTNDQLAHALYIYRNHVEKFIDVDAFGFKENGLALVGATFYEDGEVTITNATDVLRLAAVLSDSSPSLRGKFEFKRWTRSERKVLLSFLEETKNLTADIAMRPALWKKFLRGLHPGDYPFKAVQEAYDLLYRGELTTFNAEVEALLFAKSDAVLDKLKARPGEFLRRFHKLYALHGQHAVGAFVPVVMKLDTTQLLKLQGYLSTINGRKSLIYAPQGNWTKAQFAENKKVPFTEEALDVLLMSIRVALEAKMAEKYSEGVSLEGDVSHIKLQTNDQELAPYGRGTAFAIPEDVRFLRTASYWKDKNRRTIWYDNSWNFFGEDWSYLETCCWTRENAFEGGAIFSGDPVNSAEQEGRACQLIDLNLEALAAAGVRYAVWNVLCYSGVPFSQAEDVLATLQWGSDAEAGELYEPARAQMVFPLKGENLSKYVAFVDLVERKLVYLDANLYGNTSTAAYNGPLLAQRMPAITEYLRSLPSVADYFATVRQGEQKVSLEVCLTGTFA